MEHWYGFDKIPNKKWYKEKIHDKNGLSFHDPKKKMSASQIYKTNNIT